MVRCKMLVVLLKGTSILITGDVKHTFLILLGIHEAKTYFSNVVGIDLHTNLKKNAHLKLYYVGILQHTTYLTLSIFLF